MAKKITQENAFIHKESIQEEKHFLNKKNIGEITMQANRQSIYKAGAIAAILSAVSITFAIIAYFIWPYKGNTESIEAILLVLQTDRIGGLIALDVSMLFIGPITILMFLALYLLLKKVDEPMALLALILNLMAIALVIVCRPLVELLMLSDQLAAAKDMAEKARILAAGELLRLQLDGTVWAVQTAFFMLSGLINNTLMLRSPYFSKKTAWTGIIISVAGLPFFLPEIGLAFLFLNTIGSVPWCIMVAIDLLKIKQPVTA
jgi:hypothetical protein